MEADEKIDAQYLDGYLFIAYTLSRKVVRCELQHPMRSLLQVMESETDTPVIKGKACRMPSLRAPPYSVTL